MIDLRVFFSCFAAIAIAGASRWVWSRVSRSYQEWSLENGREVFYGHQPRESSGTRTPPQGGSGTDYSKRPLIVGPNYTPPPDGAVNWKPPPVPRVQRPKAPPPPPKRVRVSGLHYCLSAPGYDWPVTLGAPRDGIETDCQDQATCPYCAAKYREVRNCLEGEMDCVGCGNTFSIRRHQSVSYSTFKVEEKS